jgi:hypothetical protein
MIINNKAYGKNCISYTARFNLTMTKKTHAVKNALVPVDGSKLPSLTSPSTAWARMNIAAENLETISEVKDQLPAILGKVMALCWLNDEFQNFFISEPAKCLDDIGIVIPDGIIVTSQKSNTNRPSITVFEQREGSRFKVRLFSLSLTLMASR